MTWSNPAVLLALSALLGPVLIHLLAQRHAQHMAFPTLRFLRPARLVSVRRHVLDDLALLTVRCAILAAAVAALAGPIVVTAARREAWSRRVVRAVAGDAEAPADFGDAVFRTQRFSGESIRDDMQRAIAWLETAPPARRELVVASSFPIGSLSAADLAVVPADVGIRLVRSGMLPAARSVAFGGVLTSSGVVERELTLSGAVTTASERPAGAGSARDAWPLEILAPPAGRPIVDAAIEVVRAHRVWAPAGDRRARLVLLDEGGNGAPADAMPIRAAWMAEAIARMARDPDLQMVARREPTSTRAAIEPQRLPKAALSDAWQPVARSTDGTTLVAAASSGGRLVVASRAPAASSATPILVRAVVDALADVPDIGRAETASIPDDDLRAWSRPSLPPSTIRLTNADADDRRWFWAAALLLMALEVWMRRSRRHASLEDREAQRVA